MNKFHQDSQSLFFLCDKEIGMSHYKIGPIDLNITGNKSTVKDKQSETDAEMNTECAVTV